MTSAETAIIIAGAALGGAFTVIVIIIHLWKEVWK